MKIDMDMIKHEKRNALTRLMIYQKIWKFRKYENFREKTEKYENFEFYKSK